MMNREESKKYPRTIESRNSYLRIRAPEHLDVALEGLIRKVLKEQPKMDDIYTFAADYFDMLLKIREKAGIRKLTAQEICPYHNEEDANEMIKLASTFKRRSKESKPQTKTYKALTLGNADYARRNRRYIERTRATDVEARNAKNDETTRMMTLLPIVSETSEEEESKTEELKSVSESKVGKPEIIAEDTEVDDYTVKSSSQEPSELVVKAKEVVNDYYNDQEEHEQEQDTSTKEILESVGDIDEIRDKIKSVENEIKLLEKRESETEDWKTRQENTQVETAGIDKTNGEVEQGDEAETNPTEDGDEAEIRTTDKQDEAAINTEEKQDEAETNDSEKLDEGGTNETEKPVEAQTVKQEEKLSEAEENAPETSEGEARTGKESETVSELESAAEEAPETQSDTPNARLGESEEPQPNAECTQKVEEAEAEVEPAEEETHKSEENQENPTDDALVGDPELDNAAQEATEGEPEAEKTADTHKDDNAQGDPEEEQDTISNEKSSVDDVQDKPIGTDQVAGVTLSDTGNVVIVESAENDEKLDDTSAAPEVEEVNSTETKERQLMGGGAAADEKSDSDTFINEERQAEGTAIIVASNEEKSNTKQENESLINAADKEEVETKEDTSPESGNTNEQKTTEVTLPMEKKEESVDEDERLSTPSHSVGTAALGMGAGVAGVGTAAALLALGQKELRESEEVVENAETGEGATPKGVQESPPTEDKPSDELETPAEKEGVPSEQGTQEPESAEEKLLSDGSTLPENTPAEVQKFLDRERQYSSYDKEPATEGDREVKPEEPENTTDNAEEPTATAIEPEFQRLHVPDLLTTTSEDGSEQKGEKQTILLQTAEKPADAEPIPSDNTDAEGEDGDDQDREVSTTSDEIEFDTYPEKDSGAGADAESSINVGEAEVIPVSETQREAESAEAEESVESVGQGDDSKHVTDHSNIEQTEDNNDVTAEPKIILEINKAESVDQTSDEKVDETITDPTKSFLAVPGPVLDEYPARAVEDEAEEVRIAAADDAELDESRRRKRSLDDEQDEVVNGETTSEVEAIVDCANVGNEIIQTGEVQKVELIEGEEDILQVHLTTTVETEVEEGDSIHVEMTSKIEPNFEVSVETRVESPLLDENGGNADKLKLVRAAVVIQNGFRRFKNRKVSGEQQDDGKQEENVDSAALGENLNPSITNETKSESGLSVQGNFDGSSRDSDSSFSSAVTKIHNKDFKGRSISRSATRTLLETHSLDPVRKITPLKTRSLSTVRYGVADFDVWNQLVQELEEAATKIQSNYRRYKIRKKLKRENAIQSATTTSEDSFGGVEQSSNGQRHTGEFHDSIVLPPHPQ